MQLTRGFYKIYNDPSTGKPQVYCPRCGRRIVEANPGLRYERVKPEPKA